MGKSENAFSLGLPTNRKSQTRRKPSWPQLPLPVKPTELLCRLGSAGSSWGLEDLMLGGCRLQSLPIAPGLNSLSGLKDTCPQQVTGSCAMCWVSAMR